MYANNPNRPAGSQDLYETPAFLTREILPLVPAGARLWEPCYGNGAIYNVFRDSGFKVIGTDYITVAPNGKGDFLTMAPPAYDFIVTNPPFKTKTDWVIKFIATGKPFIFLYPLTALAGVGCGTLWQENPSIKFIIVKRSQRFLHEGRIVEAGFVMWVAGNGAAPGLPRISWVEGKK
jgi:hypothetical protein